MSTKIFDGYTVLFSSSVYQLRAGPSLVQFHGAAGEEKAIDVYQIYNTTTGVAEAETSSIGSAVRLLAALTSDYLDVVAPFLRGEPLSPGDTFEIGTPTLPKTVN